MSAMATPMAMGARRCAVFASCVRSHAELVLAPGPTRRTLVGSGGAVRRGWLKPPLVERISFALVTPSDDANGAIAMASSLTL